MTILALTAETHPPVDAPDDRLLAPTRWTARAIVPVLVAAFVILFCSRATPCVCGAG
jgi:hypothetical protein